LNKTTKTSCVVTYLVPIPLRIYKHNGNGTTKQNSDALQTRVVCRLATVTEK